MRQHLAILTAIVSLSPGAAVFADPASELPPALRPAVKCIDEVLKSSSKVQSVSLYSVDGFRFAVEYAFRDSEDHVVVYDIELIGDADGSVAATDKVPREISKETMDEAFELELKLDLQGKCHLTPTLDNLMPGPAARSDWRKID
jgi:hypothetical protein